MYVTFTVGELVSYSVLVCANKTTKLHVITTCVCTIHAFALLYANTKIILISVQF